MSNKILGIQQKYGILLIGIIALAFVLGMILENRLMINRFDSYVQHYKLVDGGYTIESNESFGFFVVDKDVGIFYNDFIVPSLKGEIVCLKNDKPFLTKGDSNETI
mgnify:CR=1 FL=1